MSFLQNTEGRGVGNLTRRFYGTDASGSFHAALDLSSSGSYWVLAKKEESDYPETILAFYADYEPPLVALHCGAAVSGIVVRLGSKSAYITHAEVLDAVTARPIENASITFRRVHPPFRGVSSAQFSITTSATSMNAGPGYPGFPIPSNADISYEISAPGYKTSAPHILHLAPLKTAEISVKLVRSASNSAKAVKPPTLPENREEWEAWQYARVACQHSTETPRRCRLLLPGLLCAGGRKVEYAGVWLS